MRHTLLLCLSLLTAPAVAQQATVYFAPSTGWAEPIESGPQGASIDLMMWFVEWLAQHHDQTLSLDFVMEPDWQTFYAKVRDSRGGVFGLGNVTITEARKEELAFSPGYAHNVALRIAPQGVAWDALFDLRGASFAGTLHAQRMAKFDVALDAVHSNADLLALAAAGSHFAVIDGYNAIQAQASGLPIAIDPDYADGGEQFGIIMPLDNPWQARLTEFFISHDLPDNDRWRGILRHHLGEEIAELMSRP